MRRSLETIGLVALSLGVVFVAALFEVGPWAALGAVLAATAIFCFALFRITGIERPVGLKPRRLR